MRISDWSSDVCASDLHYYDTGNGGIEHAVLAEIGKVFPGALVFGADSHTCTAGALNASGIGFGSTDLAAALALGELWARVGSEERRVGKEGVMTCRSRWAP